MHNILSILWCHLEVFLRLNRVRRFVKYYFILRFMSSRNRADFYNWPDAPMKLVYTNLSHPCRSNPLQILHSLCLDALCSRRGAETIALRLNKNFGILPRRAGEVKIFREALLKFPQVLNPEAAIFARKTTLALRRNISHSNFIWISKVLMRQMYTAVCVSEQ